ncbi:MAG: hypothetical protein H0W50_06125 [Parachlamydiaceae bacterium]|nr:hypothetical protein [Parachlamydiaceae bacterium]
MMNSLRSQYENHLKKPENRINLKEFVKIASENLQSIISSSECILVAGKLNLLICQYEKNAEEKEFTLPFFATLEEKAHKLEQNLKGIYSEDELNHYFMTGEFKVCEPIKQTIKLLTPNQVRDYTKKNVFHLRESIEGVHDPILNDLITTFSDEQRHAFFQGITEMNDQEQAFRQLFCCISIIHPPLSYLVFESFPENHFINYFANNLENIKGKKTLNGLKEFWALNGIIIEGRLNPIAELVILDAVKNNNYLRSNWLLIHMKFNLGLESNLVYKGVTADQISTFQRNSTVDLQFQKQKTVSDYMLE